MSHLWSQCSMSLPSTRSFITATYNCEHGNWVGQVSSKGWIVAMLLVKEEKKDGVIQWRKANVASAQDYASIFWISYILFHWWHCCLISGKDLFFSMSAREQTCSQMWKVSKWWWNEGLLQCIEGLSIFYTGQLLISGSSLKLISYSASVSRLVTCPDLQPQ